MKTQTDLYQQELPPSTHLILEEEETQQINRFDQLPTHQCPNSHPAQHICCHNNCSQIAFICNQSSCLYSHTSHSNCPQLLIQSLTTKIQSLILPSPFSSLLDQIDKTFDSLSQFRDQIQSIIKQHFSHYGLSTNQKKLQRLLNKPDSTGNQVFQAFVNCQNQSYEFLEQEPIQAKFNQIWQQVNVFIRNKSDEFVHFLTEKALFQNDFPLIFKNSLVIDSKQQQQTLKNMFNNQLLTSANLLYRASQNDFRADLFHQKCDLVPNTITLCKTIYGKVIGGYTPLKWDKSYQGFQTDPTQSSFVFSLTNKHKFSLENDQQAIFQREDCGPIFGQDDFCIMDKANADSVVSGAVVNTSYFNYQYQAEDGESYKKFTGNPNKTNDFKPKEWQVWHVYMESPESEDLNDGTQFQREKKIE